ncbi:MAG: hypothetical protein AVDCRST_MAG55-1173 [uncultured Rubrobacteraceae bacterium]|uniref:Uncharacterized protein n=1 Tax=uncultured Rubrobacteraceae bacterium TaxID=349277 RepID=A0A6J4P7X5_9ACTN|nr:MAG: hypothetical protein AVDCRST_MAG55-1173 [uncultured Rubrobacteraceae bacterium]
MRPALPFRQTSGDAQALIIGATRRTFKFRLKIRPPDPPETGCPLRSPFGFCVSAPLHSGLWILPSGRESLEEQRGRAVVAGKTRKSEGASPRERDDLSGPRR